MHVSYDLTVDDLVSMSVHNFKTAAVWQQQQRRGRIVIGLITTLLCLGGTFLIPHVKLNLLTISLALVAGAVIFAVHPKLVEPTLRKRLAKFFQSDSGSGMVGTYTLALTEDSITQSHQTSTHQYEWKQLERLDVTEQHLYIFAGKSNCITVPKNMLDVQDIKAIIDVLNAHNVVINQVTAV